MARWVCENCGVEHCTTTGSTCDCDKDGNSPRDLIIKENEKLQAQLDEARELLGECKEFFKSVVIIGCGADELRYKLLDKIKAKLE